MKSIELFSGAGGMAIGTHAAGFRHVALFECDPRPLATLNLNMTLGSLPDIDHWAIHEMDVRAVRNFARFDGLDLVAGGAPCQPFSHAGRREGKADHRNMIPEFVRAIREAAPRAFIFENVRGLVNATFESYFSFVRLQLAHPELSRRPGESWMTHHRRLAMHDKSGSADGLRYDVSWRVINAANFGIPQARERVFVVGFRSDLHVNFDFPAPTHSRDALLYSQHIQKKYWERHGVRRKPPLPNQIPRVAILANRVEPELLPWTTVRDAIGHLHTPLIRQRSTDPIGHYLYPGARAYHGHTGSDWDWPAKALKAGAHGVSGGENAVSWRDGRIRYFTEYEAARLQSFPESWRFAGGWQATMRQIGNAVPPALAEIVGRAVYERLGALDAFAQRAA